MTPTSVLSFDPGGTTGWCALKDGKLAGGSFHQWDRVESLISNLKPDVVVAEDWLLYSWMAKKLSWDRMIAPRVLGVIEYCCQKHEVRLVFQSASEGKTIKLKKIDGVEDLHTYDAIRHALYYCRGQGEIAPYRHYLLEGRVAVSDDGLEPKHRSKNHVVSSHGIRINKRRPGT